MRERARLSLMCDSHSNVSRIRILYLPHSQGSMSLTFEFHFPFFFLLRSEDISLCVRFFLALDPWCILYPRCCTHAHLQVAFDRLSRAPLPLSGGSRRARYFGFMVALASGGLCVYVYVCIGCAHDCFIGLALYGGTTLSLELLALIFRVFFSLRDRLLGNFGTNLDHRSLL